MKQIENGSDFKALYSKTVKECVSLVDKECELEQEQISLALKMGEKIEQLVATEGEAVIKKLARDIFKERQKIIPPSKLFEYRQLFLDLGSMETVKTLVEKSLNDVTMDSLIKIARNGKETDGVRQSPRNEIVATLYKALNCLNRVERMLDEKGLSDDELAEILKAAESVKDKAGSVLRTVEGNDGKRQLDMFRSAENSHRSCVALQ